MKSIQSLFLTVLILCCFFVIAPVSEEVVSAGSLQLPPYPIPLPQTGQTTCYGSTGGGITCGGTGQDGEIRAGVAWPDPRFTVSGECVTDNLTGLMWSKNADLPGGARTWQAALDFANGLTLCGHSDWRLPNVNEMESLLHADMSDSAAWLNTTGFTNVRSDYYWSSTSQAFSAANGWVVGMGHGSVDWGDKENFLYVWPVRSGW